ncbi:hypothetical protein EDB89DRAFT_1901717 [Lactarius sanguifluus]|nr:hypothetical protein EDB89DRAFT_1901717 [Lactarius sanguifluus]
MFYQRRPPLFRRGCAHEEEEEEEDDAAKYLGERTTIRFAQWAGRLRPVRVSLSKSLTIADELRLCPTRPFLIKGRYADEAQDITRPPRVTSPAIPETEWVKCPWQKSKSYASTGNGWTVSSILNLMGSPWPVPVHMEWLAKRRDHRGRRRLTRTFHEDYSSLKLDIPPLEEFLALSDSDASPNGHLACVSCIWNSEAQWTNHNGYRLVKRRTFHG